MFSDSDEDDTAQSKKAVETTKSSAKVSCCVMVKEREVRTCFCQSSDVSMVNKKSSPPPPTTHSTAPDPDWRGPARSQPPQGAQRPESPSERKRSSRPPHPYPVYPSYPFYGDPYGRYPVYPHGMPPYGFHPPPRPGAHYHTDRGSSLVGRSDRDDKRHDFHPWDHESEHIPRRKWNEDRDQRPKVLTKEKDWRGPPAKHEEKPLTPDEKQWVSEPSDSAHLVTLAPRPKSQDVESDRLSPSAPAMRSQPKKIMLRKMSDSSKTDAAEAQEKLEPGKPSDQMNNVKSQHAGKEQESSDAATGNSAKPRPTAWKITDRASTTSAKTLYEPEGKKSEAKFRKYQQDARGGGKRERAGPSPATTPSDTQPPAHIPDVRTNERVALKRTYSSDRSREGEGRRGRGGDSDRSQEGGEGQRGRGGDSDRSQEGGEGRRGRGGDRHEDGWTAEPPRNQSDQQDHSGPLQETKRGQSDRSDPNRDHHDPQEPQGRPVDHSGPDHHDRHEPHEGQRNRSRPKRGHRDQLQDHSKVHSDHSGPPRWDGCHSIPGRPPRDTGRQESKRRERVRSDRRSRGSETDELKQGSQPTKPRPQSLEDQTKTVETEGGWSEEETVEGWEEELPSPGGKPTSQQQSNGEPGSQQWRRGEHPSTGEQEKQGRGREKRRGSEQGRGGEQRRGGERGSQRQRGGGQGRPIRSQRLHSREQDTGKPREDHNRVSGRPRKTSQTASPTSSTVPTTAVATAPASVPQTVINKSVSVQTSDLSLASHPLAFPQRPPLLENPPLALRREPLEPKPDPRQRDTMESRRRLDRQRGGPEGSRGRWRGSQRGKGERENGHHGRQEMKSSGLAVEVEGDRGDRGRSDRRGSQRRGRGRRGGGGAVRQASGTPEDNVAPPPHDVVPPVDHSRRDSGRGRERRQRDRGSRKQDSSTSVAEGSQRPHRETRDTGRATAGQRRDKREWGKGQRAKPSTEKKLTTGYADLEDIESGSDWENDRVLEWRKGEGDTMSEASVPPPSQDNPKSRGRSQKEQEQHESARNDLRPSGGRGRGRGRQGSLKRGVGRPADASDTPHEETPVATEPEKLSDVHKQQEFAKYDLTSTTIAIVDDIGSHLQPEEVENAVEFVEVTSKKAQKEKVKKEREQWRQAAVESKEELKKSRKPATARPSDHTATQQPLKPSTAWSSKGEDNPQSNIWSSSTAGSSDWSTVLGPVTAGATGEQFTQPQSWTPMGVSSGVGVIGEGLQARPVTTTTANQTEHPTTTSGYSLFPVDHSLSSLISAGPYSGSGGGMLNAAVNMKLSQEHLPSPSGEPALLGAEAGGVAEGGRVRDEKDAESPLREPPVVQPHQGSKSRADDKLSSSHSGHSKASLPPRLQSSRSNPGSGVGRGRGSTRGRRGERARRGGDGGERKDHDVPGEGRRGSHREHRAHDKVVSYLVNNRPILYREVVLFQVLPLRSALYTEVSFIPLSETPLDTQLQHY